MCLVQARSPSFWAASYAGEMKPGPADGFDIHVMAPHKMEDGSVAGPSTTIAKPLIRKSCNACCLNRLSPTPY